MPYYLNIFTGEFDYYQTGAAPSAATFDFMDDDDFLFMDDTGFDFMDA